MGEGITKYGGRAVRMSPSKKSMADDVLSSLRTRRKELTAQKRDTDSRMTEAQRKAVLDYEDKVQKLKTERSAIIDADGRIMSQSTRGTNNRTSLPYNRNTDYSNAVITHNHPNSDDFGANLAGRVNNTLSHKDMYSAVLLNVKGMRVRSGGGYSYSVERTGKTWGVDADTFRREHNALSSKYVNEAFEGIRNVYMKKLSDAMARGDINEYNKLVELVNARSNVAGQHRAMKELSKKYGFKYTHHS